MAKTLSNSNRSRSANERFSTSVRQIARQGSTENDPPYWQISYGLQSDFSAREPVSRAPRRCVKVARREAAVRTRRIARERGVRFRATLVALHQILRASGKRH